MSGSSRYVLDANVFIQAKNGYYGFRLCPGFWRALIVQHKTKRLFSIDKVFRELTDVGDDLSDWVKETVPDSFFKKTENQAVIDQFRQMAAWVDAEPQFAPAAKSEFASAADGWLIAYAKVNGLIVVTHEEFAPEVKKRVAIPNVCLEFDVEYLNTFEMLNDLGVQFFLRTKHQRRR